MQSIADKIIKLGLSLPLIGRIKPNFRTSPDRKTTAPPGKGKKKKNGNKKNKKEKSNGVLDTYV